MITSNKTTDGGWTKGGTKVNENEENKCEELSSTPSTEQL